MLGFEIEIDLPVTDEDGDEFDGELKLAVSTTQPGFKLVSDNRTLTNDDDYSNIEFVTNAVSVVGTRRDAGKALVLAQLTEVERVKRVLYAAGSVALDGVDGTLDTSDAEATALLAPDLPYRETNRLLVHYSVGVPLAGMPDFFDRLRQAAPVPQPNPNTDSANYRDRFSLVRAKDFAAAELARFQTFANAPRPDSPESRGLDGYLQLAYTQVCAFADNLDLSNDDDRKPEHVPLIKNSTAVLCRSALADVLPLLGATARRFLASRLAVIGDTNLISVLAAFQEMPEPGRAGDYTFYDEGESAHTPTVTLQDFAQAAFTDAVRVDPISVFGDMSVIAPHLEEGATMVPMEIRTINNEAKTWQEVNTELTDLCAWAQAAFLLA